MMLLNMSNEMDVLRRSPEFVFAPRVCARDVFGRRFRTELVFLLAIDLGRLHDAFDNIFHEHGETEVHCTILNIGAFNPASTFVAISADATRHKYLPRWTSTTSAPSSVRVV
jgi:hypothetical protein